MRILCRVCDQSIIRDTNSIGGWYHILQPVKEHQAEPSNEYLTALDTGSPLTYGQMKEFLESKGVREDSIMLNVVDVNFHPGPNMVAIFIGDNL